MNLLDYVEHVSNTVFGLYQHKYCDDWDKRLNEILDSAIIIGVNDCTLTVQMDGASYEIWIGNKFYSYGNARMVDSVFVPRRWQRRPSIKTMHRLSEIASKHASTIERAELERFKRKHGL